MCIVVGREGLFTREYYMVARNASFFHIMYMYMYIYIYMKALRDSAIVLVLS